MASWFVEGGTVQQPTIFPKEWSRPGLGCEEHQIPSPKEPAVTAIDLPALAPEYEETRATIHAYTNAVIAIPRAHGIAHPKWWHVSLEVRPEGLVTDPIPLPDGRIIAFTMDLQHHAIILRSSDGAERRFDPAAGLTGTEMGDAVIAAASEFGLDEPYDHARFESDEPRAYDPVAAATYFDAFTKVTAIFERHRIAIGERVGPVQVWPHGFDLAFEWFGTRTVDRGDEVLPAQINLGFYPGGDPYFYSSPWPFDASLTDVPLPHGAVWNTDGWQGAMLPYATVRNHPDPTAALTDFARAVFDAAAPSLTAP